MQIDSIDHALISLLRQNARESVATLASKLGVSRGTVTNRMDKLERDGVVVGYTVRLRPDVQTEVLRAWMSVEIVGNDTRRVMASLLGEPGVAALHSTNGRWDLLAELQVASLEELSRVLERIRLIKGISNTETSIHLESFRVSGRNTGFALVCKAFVAIYSIAMHGGTPSTRNASAARSWPAASWVMTVSCANTMRCTGQLHTVCAAARAAALSRIAKRSARGMARRLRVPLAVLNSRADSDKSCG